MNWRKPTTITSPAELKRLMLDPIWELSVKVDGNFIEIEKCDGVLTARNKKGETETPSGQSTQVPGPAKELLKVPGNFVVQGEAIGNRNSWYSYCIFNVVKVDNPTALASVCSQELFPDFDNGKPLKLLTRTSISDCKQRAYELVRTSPAGEGVVFRNATTGEQRKWVFLGRIDVALTRFNYNPSKPTSGGSVTGIVYLENGTQYEIANIRSGLSFEELAEMKQLYESGFTPVAEVEFLKARTVYGKLVQPRFIRLRDDKRPEECLIQQFYEIYGEQRRKFITG